jgi:hypothetical protein
VALIPGAVGFPTLAGGLVSLVVILRLFGTE